MKIQDNAVVAIHYTLKNDEGQVLDSSEGKDPLKYLHGAKNIIPGLEQALVDKTEGDDVEVSIEPKDAYGERNPEAVKQLPKNTFEGIDNLQEGMVLQAQTPQGAVPLRVVEVGDEAVTVDMNHQLAGVRLNFSVKVDSVREATAEEIEHGHAH